MNHALTIKEIKSIKLKVLRYDTKSMIFLVNKLDIFKIKKKFLCKIAFKARDWEDMFTKNVTDDN